MVGKDPCFDHGMVRKGWKEFGHGMTVKAEQMGDLVLMFSKTFQNSFQKGLQKFSTKICRCYIYKRNYLRNEPLLEPSYYHSQNAYPPVITILLRWFASTFKVLTGIVPGY